MVSKTIGIKGAKSEIVPDATMQMKKINSGKLRAIGYDARPVCCELKESASHYF